MLKWDNVTHKHSYTENFKTKGMGPMTEHPTEKIEIYMRIYNSFTDKDSYWMKGKIANNAQF